MPCTADRIVMLVWEGASSELLAPFAQTGVMPRLAAFLQESALIRLKPTFPLSTASCWASLQTGSAPREHGVLDEYYLDHHRKRVFPCTRRPLRRPTVVDVVGRRFPESPGLLISDGVGERLNWLGKPTDFDALCERVALIQTAMYRVVSEARRVDQQTEWRLLVARCESLGRLLYSLWDSLGLPNQPGGNRQWVGKTREAFRTLDRCLGELLSLAEDRGAVVVLVGPYGTTGFREKINVNTLLCRGDLLAWSGRMGTTTHRLSRRLWRLHRRLHSNEDDGRPLDAILPIQWKKTRAFTVHGRFAAMVYFNTASRFPEGIIHSASEEEETAERTVAAFQAARHPVTEEPLFREVFRTRVLCGQEPSERFWPDVVAVPAVGFHAHHRPERHSFLVRPAGQTASTHADEGLLAIRLPGIPLGEPREADLTDIAPTVLAILGLPNEPTMTGSPLAGLDFGG